MIHVLRDGSVGLVSVWRELPFQVFSMSLSHCIVNYILNLPNPGTWEIKGVTAYFFFLFFLRGERERFAIETDKLRREDIRNKGAIAERNFSLMLQHLTPSPSAKLNNGKLYIFEIINFGRCLLFCLPFGSKSPLILLFSYS